MVVRAEIEKAGLDPQTVELGEIEIKTEPTKEQLAALDHGLRHLGFEIIDDRKSQIISKIKGIIIKLIHDADENINVTLSDFIASEINLNYHYLSNLFSEVEGTTIEKYFISQRIEKAKELIVYDELTLSEIAYRLGYSSVSYFSNQFKKVTGLTPTHYKSLKDHKRKNIEEL
jgi:YesN/AraC family two-component response regulator